MIRLPTSLYNVLIYLFSLKMNITTCQAKYFWKIRFDDFDVISFERMLLSHIMKAHQCVFLVSQMSW